MISSWLSDRGCCRSGRPLEEPGEELGDMQHECNLPKLWSQVTKQGSKGRATQTANCFLQTFQLLSHPTHCNQYVSLASDIFLSVMAWNSVIFEWWNKMPSQQHEKHTLKEESQFCRWAINLCSCFYRFKMNVSVKVEHDFVFFVCTETQAWIPDGLFEGWTDQSFKLTWSVSFWARL